MTARHVENANKCRGREEEMEGGCWHTVVVHGGVAAGGLQRATDEEKCAAYEMKQVANTCEMRIVPRTAKNERGE